MNLILGTEVYQGEGPSVKMAKQIAAVQVLFRNSYSIVLTLLFVAGLERNQISISH